MTIPGIHFKLVSDKFTHFQKNRRTHFLKRSQNHRRGTSRQADEQVDTNIAPNFVWTGEGNMKMIISIKLFTILINKFFFIENLYFNYNYPRLESTLMDPILHL